MMAPPGSGSGSGSGGVDFPTDLMSLFRPAPGANLHEALNNAQQVLEVLVQAQEQQAVDVSDECGGTGGGRERCKGVSVLRGMRCVCMTDTKQGRGSLI